MKKTILALSILTLSSSVLAADPWDQDLQDLHDKLNIDDGNNVLMLFNVIGQTRSQLQYITFLNIDRLDLRIDQLSSDFQAQVDAQQSMFDSTIAQVESDFESLVNKQEKLFNAGTAASIAASNAIRGTNGFRGAVGYYNGEAAVALGARYESATVTITFDTAENAGVGVGFNF